MVGSGFSETKEHTNTDLKQGNLSIRNPNRDAYFQVATWLYAVPYGLDGSFGCRGWCIFYCN